MLQTYSGILSPELCEHLISRFDAAAHDTTYAMFDQVELGSSGAWEEESALLTVAVKKAAAHYSDKFDPHHIMPTNRLIEAFRMKRYEPNTQRFPLHGDASSIASCSRYLAFLFYLNDSDAGTRFYGARGTEPFTLEAKRGNLLVFPPMWMFPHEGLMPVTRPKYILSTYFHFAPEPAAF